VTPADDREWEEGWEGHADAQARRMAALSLAEKLDWLEDAHALVLHMQSRSGGATRVNDAPGAGGEPTP
jgi:hypothetical protein